MHAPTGLCWPVPSGLGAPWASTCLSGFILRPRLKTHPGNEHSEPHDAWRPHDPWRGAQEGHHIQVQGAQLGSPTAQRPSTACMRETGI